MNGGSIVDGLRGSPRLQSTGPEYAHAGITIDSCMPIRPILAVDSRPTRIIALIASSVATLAVVVPTLISMP